MSDERQRGTNDSPPKSNGIGHFFDEGSEGAEVQGPRPPPPQPIAELYAACMRFVTEKYKVALDGTPETLSLLDQYVREAREAIRTRPEALELVGPAVGAYLGEVIRHRFGGEWFAEGDISAYKLCFTNVYLAFNPLGMGREAITMTEAEGWGAHLTLDPADRDDVHARLAAMPEVEEDEYYLPTTRFDVITIVVETLRARAVAAGTQDVTFSKEDYD